jgi:hypothetical protein
MKVTIDEKAGTITIVAELTKPTESKSGKTLSVASTHGALVSDAKVSNKPVVVNLNCYIKA